ncbi:glutathione S-transferase family protein [Sulfitobacter albidus]|uniref:glutathione S-transferase family protein n=1 Tax=Sulfitobacter albidus TaxID=2829501 RepID=UPI0020C8B368|nr:glutathione S-transferase family protein [Sulfitobacter albidus]
MPFGKLPAIEVDGKIIADSDNIHRWLEAQGHDFDTGLSDLDRANARAFIRMAEEHMYFHQVLDRWGDEANWAVVRHEYFAFLPPVLRTLVPNKLRRDLMRTMNGQGLGRLAPAERLERIEPDLKAITARLKASPFLFGDVPSAADASVGAMIGAIAAAPKPTQLSRRVADDGLLSAYAARCAQAMG